MRIFKTGCAVLLATSMGIITGCEWEDSGTFNTSQGAGSSVNFSGFYRPKSGAVLVGSNITHLVLSQVGNSIEVRDSNNSYYSGSVGSPGTVVNRDPATGSYPAGAIMVESQINFSGYNEVTSQDVNFYGIIHAVAVNDVRGVDTTAGTSFDNTSTLDVLVTPAPGTTFSLTSTTNQNASTTITTTYEITEANSQYVLQGNWVEGGASYTVDAIAPAVSGTFSSGTTTNATP